MAKKRQRKKIYKAPAPKLETQFNCPECGRKKVIQVRFFKRENKGYLRCKACGEEYEGKLKRATTPIDVYYAWIDQRDKEKEEEYKKNEQEQDGEEEEEVEGQIEAEENYEEGEQQDNEYDNNDNDNDNEDQDKGDEDYNEDEGSDYE